MSKKSTFVLMNTLIKGTAANIQTALSKLDPDSYELIEFSYKHKNVDANDDAIIKVGVVFREIYEGVISTDEIPFASIPEIKFIGLANGYDGSRSDGSYVFYKGFGEVGVSTCYKFSPVSPFKEEFDAQYDVLNNVHRSFMDHAWQYRYEDYSCGEYCPWSFNSKKDKDLIAKWKSDEQESTKKETSEVEKEMNWNELYSIEEIDEKQVRLGKYTGTDVILSVPAVIDKKKVTSLSGTFDGYAQLQAVELPKTVTVMGSSVFRGCTELRSITLPEKLKAISSAVFEDCTSLTEIAMPQSVSLLGVNVFQNCSALSKVILSSKIKKIPMNTFARCTALTEITIPEKCREIEFFAFDGCQNLRAVHISAAVKSIGYEAFDNCPNLTIYAPAGSYAETWAIGHKIPFVAE